MWSFAARAGAFLWAHKTELNAAWQLVKQLRARRKANQKFDENARDYYKRVGKHVVVDAAKQAKEAVKA